MKEKWIVALILAVVVSCSCLTGLAEVQSVQIEAYSIKPAVLSDVLIMQIHNESGDLVDYLGTAGGTVLSDGYDNIQEDSYQPLYKVTALEPEDRINPNGLIDADGNVVIPPAYIDVKVLSDRWAVAFKAVSTDGEEYDYYNLFGSSRYLIDTVDIYFSGQLVGTLSRDDYAFAFAYGDYLCLQNRNGAYTFYNKAMEKSPYKADFSSEYDHTYVGDELVYFHQGSGEQAFCEGCSLKEEEVDQYYRIDDDKVYDLQGRAVYQAPEGFRIDSFCSPRHINVQQDDKYGIVDLRIGDVVIPVEYEDVEYYANEGYAAVKKDSMFGYVRNGGDVTCGFEYPYDEVDKYYGTLSQWQDPEGGIVVLSSTAGVLPERYKDVRMVKNGHAFVAENDDGQKALIGMNGKELIPFGDYDSVDVNQNATVAVTRDTEGMLLVWAINYTDAVE